MLGCQWPSNQWDIEEMIFAIDDRELFELTQQKFASTYDIFAMHIYPQSGSLMCKLHDLFAGPESTNHNCLGCNFDDMTEQVLKFLYSCRRNDAQYLTHQSFSLYVLLLNSIWERMNDIFEIISLPESYRCRHFGAFIRVRRWANFFKHPKAFSWRAHHPIYTIENSSHSKYLVRNSAYLRIDDEFVKKYYASNNVKGLTKEFDRHESKVVVILPDIEVLTREVCLCLEKFVEIITENKVYREILDEKSTFVSYYTALDSGTIQSTTS